MPTHELIKNLTKGNVFVSKSAPRNPKSNDVWIKKGENNSIYCFDGATWIPNNNVEKQDQIPQQFLNFDSDINFKRQELYSIRNLITDNEKQIQDLEIQKMKLTNDVKSKQDTFNNLNQQILDKKVKIKEQILANKQEKDNVLQGYKDKTNEEIRGIKETTKHNIDKIKQEHESEVTKIDDRLIDKNIALDSVEKEFTAKSLELTIINKAIINKNEESRKFAVENTKKNQECVKTFNYTITLGTKKLDKIVIKNNILAEKVNVNNKELAKINVELLNKQKELEKLNNSIDKYEARMKAINEKEIRVNKKEEAVNKLALETQTKYYNIIKTYVNDNNKCKNKK